MSKIDPIELRNAFGKFMTGVTVVTTKDTNGTPLGFTANSFSSVSLEPPLLLVCPAKSLSSFDAFANCDYFHVNVLAHDQQAVSNRFASKTGDRFEETDWQADANGSPKIAGAIASFSCKRDRSIDAGDHIILLGEVTHFDSSDDTGLGYSAGGYFSLEMERKAAELENQTNDSSNKVIAGAFLEHEDQLLLMHHGDQLQLPQIELDDEQASFDLLKEHLSDLLKCSVSVGSVFSIFEHENQAATSIYYRVSLDNDDAQANSHGALYPIKAIELDRIATDSSRTMIRRYVTEHESGNHTIYVGSESQGKIHKVGG